MWMGQQTFMEKEYVCDYKLQDKVGDLLNFTDHFYVTDVGDDKILLGMDWLEKYNPKIDWVKKEVDFYETAPLDHCVKNEGHLEYPTIRRTQPTVLWRDCMVTLSKSQELEITV